VLGWEAPTGQPWVYAAGAQTEQNAYYFGPFAPLGTPQTTAGTITGWRVSLSVPLVTGPGGTTCVQSAVRRAGSAGFAGAFDQSDVTVTASNGLQSIGNVVVSNGAVSVPAFAPGTTAPVIVTTTKNTQGLITRFSFDATDAGAGIKHCA
jgi:hypothetical protein